jgi:hypothetical protein
VIGGGPGSFIGGVGERLVGEMMGRNREHDCESRTLHGYSNSWIDGALIPLSCCGLNLSAATAP